MKKPCRSCTRSNSSPSRQDKSRYRSGRATDFARSHVQLAYRIDFITRNEKSAQLVYSIKPPWGGIAAAAEFTAVYTNREDRKRIVIPGSVFFLFDQAGKIQRVRLYMLRDETQEIEQ